MSDPTLFDLEPASVSERDLDAGRTTTVRAHTRTIRPGVRRTDPISSHQAARAVKPGGKALIEAIHAVVRAAGPTTQHTIAQLVMEEFPGRWQADTIRSACNPRRSGLVCVGNTRDTDDMEGRVYGLYDVPENVS